MELPVSGLVQPLHERYPGAAGHHVGLYADDVALVTTSLNATYAAKKLQRALDLLPAWLAEWRLALNISKTQCIIFGHQRRQPPPLRLLDQQVPWSSKATYLGVVLDRRLNMTRHVKKATQAGPEPPLSCCAHYSIRDSRCERGYRCTRPTSGRI